MWPFDICRFAVPPFEVMLCLGVVTCVLLVFSFAIGSMTREAGGHLWTDCTRTKAQDIGRYQCIATFCRCCQQKGQNISSNVCDSNPVPPWGSTLVRRRSLARGLCVKMQRQCILVSYLYRIDVTSIFTVSCAYSLHLICIKSTKLKWTRCRWSLDVLMSCFVRSVLCRVISRRLPFKTLLIFSCKAFERWNWYTLETETCL